MDKKIIFQDPIIKEVRRVREEVSKEHRKNPDKFSLESRKIAKEYGMKYAKIRPVANSLSELLAKKKKNPAA